MGFLGMSGKTWKKVGKFALQKVAPIAANFIPGVGPLASMGIRAAIGAAGGAAGGGGWKGALMGGGMGAIPTGGAGGAASGAVKTGLGTAAKQIGKQVGTQAAGSLASKYLPGQAGSIANAAISGYGGGGVGASLKNAAKAGGTQFAANQASRIPGVGGLAGGAVGAGLGTALNGQPGASFGANMRNAGKAALQQAGVGGADMAGNYAMNSLVPQQGNLPFGAQANWAGTSGGGGGGGFGASPRPGGAPGYDFSQPPVGINGSKKAVSGPTAAGGSGIMAGQPGAGDSQGQGFNWRKWGPPIAEAGGLVIGGVIGRQAQKNALKRSPEEMAALTGAQGVGRGAASAAEDAMGQSKPWMQQSGNYFSTLLSGNRAAMSQATAAPMAQISQQYRGAERGLERSGVRGAARDVAAGELGRERVSKMAGLTTGVQPYAAEQLGKMGLDAQGNAAGLYGVAGNVYGNLLDAGQRNRVYSREEGGKTAEAIGRLGATVGNTIANQPQKPAPVPGAPKTPKPTSGVPGNIPGQQPLPTVPKFPAPRPAPYPGGKVTPPFGQPAPGGGVTPPVFGQQGAGDYNPYKAIYM